MRVDVILPLPHRQQYYDRRTELLDLEKRLELSQKIQTSSVGDIDKDKLQAKIKKAQAEVEKAKGK